MAGHIIFGRIGKTMMSDMDTLSNLDNINADEACAQAEKSGDTLTASQQRMKALMERHEALLAFNEKLEAALRNKDSKVIDECIEHSRNNDYMAQHRSYMAELQKDLANQVMN